MTDDILNKMDERKAVKGRNEEHYQQLNKEISNDCRLAKENWLNEQCREVEDLERQFRTKEMHQKVKQITENARQTHIWVVSRTDMVIFYLSKKRQQRDGYNT